MTGRTLEQISTANDAVWQSNRIDPRPSNSRTAQKTPQQPRQISAPKFVEPMLAREVTALPEGKDWIYEIKFDGYRGLAKKHGAAVELRSRKNKRLDSEFPEVVSSLCTIKADTALIDGEVVAVDAQGKPSFQLLQKRGTQRATIVFYAFDLLSLNGEDWTARPLEQRKSQLAEIVAGTDVKFSSSFAGPAKQVIAGVAKLGLEGVVAKRRNSPYRSGERSGDWVKLKLSPEQQFVIGGYKRGAPIESLVVGYYQKGKLVCAGRVRQGLNPRLRRELADTLKPHLTTACPFANLPNSQRSHWGEGITAEQMAEINWVRPHLVAQVSFTEWTEGGNLRHATFKGLRSDKRARDVRRETGGATAQSSQSVGN